MGKCLRSCRPRLSPAAVEAAACLTLRSGRRVPAAASTRRRHRCGYNPASARKGAAGGSASAAARQRRRRRVLNSLGAGREVEEELTTPSSQEDSPVVCNESRGDRWATPHSGEAKHGHEINNGVAPGGPLSSPPEAEIEAFFTAAELAVHRRFAETYNYDVALDRPLEGRYEWAPVIEHARG